MRKILLLLIVFFICFMNYSVIASEIDEETLQEIQEAETELASSSVSGELSINSRRAVILERNSNMVLYGEKENEVVAMASTTKIMTAIIVLENANLDIVVEVSGKAADTGGSRLGLTKGAKITVRDLLYGLMLCSGNDSAVALAEFVGGSVEGFATMMNDKAKNLNLQNTNFESPHGLDSVNHHTTAYELAVLTDYALDNKMFREIVNTTNYNVTINGESKNINNTNELLGYLDGVYGVKTGFTNNAGRCLVTATKRNDLDIICVVLGADTKKIRTQDSVKLIEYACKNFKNINLQMMIDEKFDAWKKNKSGSIKIQRGIKNEVEIGLDKTCKKVYTVNENQLNNVSVSIMSTPIIQAPVRSEQVVGGIRIMLNGEIIESVNMIAKEGIDKKNVMDYFIELVDKVC